MCIGRSHYWNKIVTYATNTATVTSHKWSKNVFAVKRFWHWMSSFEIIRQYMILAGWKVCTLSHLNRTFQPASSVEGWRTVSLRTNIWHSLKLLRCVQSIGKYRFVFVWFNCMVIVVTADSTWCIWIPGGGGSHIDIVYVYVPAFWGTFSRNLV